MDNRRKTIVINKKFQYQYSLLIAALALAAVEFILVASIWYGSLVASLSHCIRHNPQAVTPAILCSNSLQNCLLLLPGKGSNLQ
jgi:hypothetical protein